MNHLARAGALLLLAVGMLMVVRIATSQASVPLIGLVREDYALQLASSQPRFAGITDNNCVACHADIDLQWSRSAHSGQTCEACHGAGDRHVTYGAVMPPAGDMCITCHSQIPGRPAYFPTIKEQEHFPTQACTSCHNPHAPAAAFPLIPHNVKGREDCLACHGNGVAGLPPNHKNRPVEVCLGCHKPANAQAPEEPQQNGPRP